jgi:hypothetical protein
MNLHFNNNVSVYVHIKRIHLYCKNGEQYQERFSETIELNKFN